MHYSLCTKQCEAPKEEVFMVNALHGTMEVESKAPGVGVPPLTAHGSCRGEVKALQGRAPSCTAHRDRAATALLRSWSITYHQQATTGPIKGLLEKRTSPLLLQARESWISE